MTNHWIDIKNADAILIMGSNAAEHRPISFKWVLDAKYNRGTVVMHVDPKFSRTSVRSDFHVPLRSGTDIAGLGKDCGYSPIGLFVKRFLHRDDQLEQAVGRFEMPHVDVPEKQLFLSGQLFRPQGAMAHRRSRIATPPVLCLPGPFDAVPWLRTPFDTGAFEQAFLHKYGLAQVELHRLWHQRRMAPFET